MFDLHDEYKHWAGDGCEAAASCFDCPLPQCRYDDWQAYERYKRDQRWASIAALAATHGRQATARLFGVSVRTVDRATRRFG